MKRAIINSITGDETIEEYTPDSVDPQTDIPETIEETVRKLKVELAMYKQASAENSESQQQLLELLLDLGVI